MGKYIIDGKQKLQGAVSVSGSKNAALGVLSAAMQLDGPCSIENIPNVADLNAMMDICRSLGALVERDDRGVWHIDPRPIHTADVHHEKCRIIRGSYYLLGALLGRFGKASIDMPGGCNFGQRPIDQHIKGFEALGAKTAIEHGRIRLQADMMRGANIYLDVVSVGATINLMIAATRTPGTTVLENVAREPHIVDVANFLNTMGARIRGAGTETIRITGVHELPGRQEPYSIIPDQIEAGTYMLAAAVTRGDVRVRGVIPNHMEPLTAKLTEIGARVETGDDWIRVYVPDDQILAPASFKTRPYPGFPTDLQPQTTVLLCTLPGSSTMAEDVWDNRFQYIDDLKNMGADILLAGHVAVINGGRPLTGARVMARDLRAGAAMVLAAIAAAGTTEICDIEKIERGYENFIDKMAALGAIITRTAD